MSTHHKPLYLLPFDHRSFLAKGLFESTLEGLSPEQRASLSHYKETIYKGFLKAIERGIPADEGAILVDEEYGLSILRDAKEKGITTVVTTEKSGTEAFEFEYGEDFREHLKNLRPTLAKALVHSVSAGSPHLTENMLRLRELSVFCKNEDMGFLLEPLTPAPMEERAEAIATLIADFYKHGIEPDIWKVEGVPEPAGYERIVSAARAGGRSEVGVIVLGRGEDLPTVKKWLSAARNIPGMIGFAVGRSIFWEAILSLHKGEISEEEASEIIAGKFLECYHVFTGTTE